VCSSGCVVVVMCVVVVCGSSGCVVVVMCVVAVDCCVPHIDELLSCALLLLLLVGTQQLTVCCF